jgi:hypothetical protein
VHLLVGMLINSPVGYCLRAGAPKFDRNSCARFAAVTDNSGILAYDLVSVCKYLLSFQGHCCLHLQDPRTSKNRPEPGDSMPLRRVSNGLPIGKGLFLRRRESFSGIFFSIRPHPNQPWDPPNLACCCSFWSAN